MNSNARYTTTCWRASPASGRQYTYQNPLNTDRSERWEWHPCPCCPPMFLKIVSATPEFIYARDDKTVYVNLFIGSDADIALGDTQVHVRQQTQYPVDGKVVLTLTPEKAARFTVKVRIPAGPAARKTRSGCTYPKARPRRCSR